MRAWWKAWIAVIGLNVAGAGESASLGGISGEIRFENVTPAVAAYLMQQSVTAGTGQPVRLYQAGVEAARGDYAAAGNFLPSSYWRAATYSLNPQVNEAGGTSFQVEVDTLTMSRDGAQYRFGARVAGLPGTLTSPAVLPLAAAPAGATFHVAETPCLVRAKFKLSGDAADLNALGSAAFACTAFARVQEGSQVLPQAQATRLNLSRSMLSANGETVELLFRDQQNVTRGGFCSVRPPAGSGFAVNDQGMAVFQGVPGNQSGSCSNPIAQDIDIRVVRAAGALTGYFDVSGETETDATIFANRNNDPALGRTVNPSLFSAAQAPGVSDRWRIDNVVPGTYNVHAYARLRNGDAVSVLPHRWSGNGPVQVATSPMETELGATFVTRATPANGQFILTDPSGVTEMRMLATSPLPQSKPWNMSWWNGPLSFLEVKGGPETLPGGVAGVGASAFGRLRGDASAPGAACANAGVHCQLDYTLLLTGLSQANDARDGSGTRNTGYQFGGVNLSFGSPDQNYQHSFSTIALSAPQLRAGPAATPVTLDSIGVCVGQIDYNLRINPSSGNLFQPILSGDGQLASSNTFYSPSAVNRTDLRLAEGMPKSAAMASSSAKVLATLPEGMRYRLTPQVTFAPADGAAGTTITLPERNLPAAEGSVLGCGQIAGACEKINNPATGDSTLLSIGIGNAPTCRPDGSVSVNVYVNSGGENVDSLTYRIGNGPETSLCGTGGCGVDPVRALPPSGQGPLLLPAGGTITIRAASHNGCDASYVYTVQSACQEPAQRRQLAFFDGGQLKVRDLVAGALVASANMPAGRIRYSHDGFRMLVLAPTQTKLLDADSLADLPPLIPGVPIDAAFRPNDSQTIAFLSQATGGAFLLGVASSAPGAVPVLPMVITPNNVAVAGVVATSGVQLIWSRDGTRITVAYDARAANGVRVLRTTEFRFNSSGQLETVPQRDGQFPLAAGETLTEIAYTRGATEFYTVATTGGLYSLRSNGVLQRFPASIGATHAVRSDLHRNGVSAFVAYLTEQAKLVSDVYAQEPSGFVAGEVTPGGLAVSDYFGPSAPLTAVARRRPVAAGVPVNDVISVYILASQNGVTALRRTFTFTDLDNPRFLAFRPAAP